MLQLAPRGGKFVLHLPSKGKIAMIDFRTRAYENLKAWYQERGEDIEYLDAGEAIDLSALLDAEEARLRADYEAQQQKTRGN